MARHSEPRSIRATYAVPTMVAELKARKLTADALTAWGLVHLLDDAQLVVTELVHGANLGLTLREESLAQIRLQLGTVGHNLMIEVEDTLIEWIPEVYSNDDVNLIEKISDLWGVRRSAMGKTIWALLWDDDQEPPLYLSGEPWPASGEPWRHREPGSD
ncbi:ATP-binding protein [Streptomyces zaomyceticus]|uniref:ATP-binding protein n=1 Tax=Streptomyces zaomyceticus TaxID=68286 RepID=UPI00367449B7